MRPIRPDYLPFDFAIIAAGATSDVNVWSTSGGDFLCYGINTFNATAGLVHPFRVQFFDYDGLLRLSDDEISDHAFEADARTPFYFPCPLLIKENTRITCRLRNLSGSLTFTGQLCLFGTLIHRGSYCPDRLPFIYSYYFDLSQPDTSSLGALGSVPNAFNFTMLNGAGKPPLNWDFELTHISMDERVLSNTSALYYALQVFDRKTRRPLFRVPCSEYLGCGTMISASNTAAGLTAPTGLPTNNTIAHALARPLRFKKHSQLGVRLMQQPGKQSSGTMNIEVLNQAGLNVLLMGNRILEGAYAA